MPELPSLLDRVSQAILESGCDCTLLCDEDAQEFLKGLADSMCITKEQYWWWDEARQGKAYLPFEGLEFAAWERMLRRLVPTDRGVLVITDELLVREWVILGLAFDQVPKVLGELPPTEFFLADESMSWILFETHHDSFVGFGEPVVRLIDEQRETD